MNRIFKTFACCIPIAGYLRSIIYDLQRKDFWEISNQLYHLLLKDYIAESEITDLVGSEVVDNLIENEIIFSCNIEDINCFPQLQTEYYNPSLITNCIIDIGNHLSYNLEKVIPQLNNLGLIKLQIRFFKKVKTNELFNVIDLVNDGYFSSLELILPNTDIDINQLLKKYDIITSLILYNSENCLIRNIHDCSVIFTNESLSSVSQCGIIEQEYFICSQENFIESINHNSCLNKKISIDVNGNIKNCPSCNHSFGNINEITIQEVLSNPDFKKLWDITKDQIDVCMNCEFRHMCVDCRAILKDPENIYSQPAKCKYNPYIAKWEGEEGYVPVDEC